MTKADLPIQLRAILNNLPRIVLAFSGGGDSRFLAHAAQLCGCALIAINARGPHIAPADTAYAHAWAKARAIRLKIIDYDPLNLSEVSTNSRERCYACKKGLLERIAPLVEPGWTICDGGNADDQKVFRPGNRAAKEAGIISPLALAGMGKQEIREYARITGLENPEQPSRPCLLTRLHYGCIPAPGILENLARCEEALATHFAANMRADLDFRIRLIPEPVLQITELESEKEKPIREIMAQFGFAPAKILKTAKISGFFDKSDVSGLQ